MAARSKSSVKETEKTEAPGVDKKREDALNSALAQVEKQFGKGSAMRLGDRPEQDIEVIPTGSLALDTALGIGGLPRGRIVEIYGPESSGKTTLALHVVANAQKNGGVAAFIDAEHALDPVYARHLGVDTDSLIVSQPDNGEQALKSPTCSFVPGLLTSSSSIRWRRWCRRPRSKAIWVTATSVCRQGS